LTFFTHKYKIFLKLLFISGRLYVFLVGKNNITVVSRLLGLIKWNMTRTNGQLDFLPSSRVNILDGLFTDVRYVPSNQLLYFKGYYRVGNLKTDLDNDVTVIKFIPDSMDLLLLERIQGKEEEEEEEEEARKVIDAHPYTIILDEIQMPYNQIIPEYNCHGLCFGDSLYRIPDATKILEDEYDKCPEDETCCVIFFDEQNVTIHSALRNENGTYKSKGGYRGILDEVGLEESIGPEFNNDRTVFYKKRN
jgi:hypothetical protein